MKGGILQHNAKRVNEGDEMHTRLDHNLGQVSLQGMWVDRTLTKG